MQISTKSKQNNFFKPLSTSSSITEQVCDTIKDVILRGIYKPNQRLNEVELASSLGISRSPIREAIQRLANDGLLKLIPRRGAFVFNFSSKEIEELLEVRECIEVMAVRLAVERADQSQLHKLSEFLKATRAVIERNRYTLYPWDFDFHLQIAGCAKNRKLEDNIYKTNAQLLLMRYRSGSKSGRAEQAFNEHTKIYKALCERNHERANQSMMQHLRNSKESIMQIFFQENNLSPIAPNKNALKLIRERRKSL
jgi:DNA-binding GntR family transcriptional regulator